MDVEPEPGEVDKTQLQELINSTVSLDSSLYTPESWADVVAKLADATDLTFNDEATQDEVDLAYSALRWSVDNLVDAVEGPGEVHKDSFLHTIEEAQALDSTYYESESWGTLQSALDSALIVYEDEESTEADYYIHQSILLDAMNSLVELKTLLQMALDRVNYELYEYNYSLESWTQLQTDYDYGFGVYENPDATGRMYTLAINRINKAIEELVEEERARPLRLDLLELIDNVEFIYVEELYTPDTFHQLKSKLTDGRIVAEDVETTDEIAQEWIDTIHSKIEALVDSEYELPQNEHLRGIVSAIESIDVDNKLDNDMSNQVYFMELTHEHENIESLIVKTKNGTFDETEEMFTNYPHRIVAVKVNEGAGQGVQDYLEFLDSFLKDNAESQFPNFLDEASDIRIVIHGDFLFLYTIGTVEQNDEARDIIDSFFSEGGVPTDPTESYREAIRDLISDANSIVEKEYNYTDESMLNLKDAISSSEIAVDDSEYGIQGLLVELEKLTLAISNVKTAPPELVESLYRFEKGVLVDFNYQYIEDKLDGIQPVDLVFPSKYRGKIVNTIGGGLYTTSNFQNKGIRSISIPEGYVRLPNNFMLNNELTSIDLPSTLRFIGRNAFNGNSIEGTVNIPNGIVSLNEGVFDDNLINEVIFPEGITRIDGFSNNSLTELIIPESVGEIGNFSNNNISSISIPDGVVSIGRNAFLNNTISGEVVLPENLRELGGNSFRNNLITKINIPKNLSNKTLSHGAFKNNLIKEFVIPEGIEELVNETFAFNEIETLVIPDSVKVINSGVVNTDIFEQAWGSKQVYIYANLLEGDEFVLAKTIKLRGYNFPTVTVIVRPLDEYIPEELVE